jgi:hypothetical protein
MPPSGDLEQADHVVGFAFDTQLDAYGFITASGSTNEALAEFIVGHEVLRTKNMTLQEEIAWAVADRDPSLKEQIDRMRSLKMPGKTRHTYELINGEAGGLRDKQAHTLAVVAFRHHLPRVAATVRKAGFQTLIPDMAGVGDFNLNSSLPWTRSRYAWYKRERVAIPYFALRGWI